MVRSDLFLLGEAGQLSPSQMWVLIGLGIMGLVYSAIIRPMMRRKKDPLERPPAFASISQQRSVERQMQNLLVELSEMARQITAQLDTRASKLEALISDADRRIEELRKILSVAGNGTPREWIISNADATKSESSGGVETESADIRHAEIYALADQGRDPHEIAAQLNRPSGEVELILALRSKG